MSSMPPAPHIPGTGTGAAAAASVRLFDVLSDEAHRFDSAGPRRDDPLENGIVARFFRPEGVLGQAVVFEESFDVHGDAKINA